VNGLARADSGFKAANAAYQPVEGSRIIERVGEFDPGRGSQKCGQAAPLRPLGEGLWDKLSVEDRRALSPLFHGHINPYGQIAIDLAKPSFLETV